MGRCFGPDEDGHAEASSGNHRLVCCMMCKTNSSDKGVGCTCLSVKEARCAPPCRQAIEVDPDKNMCTINLYSLDRVALEDFHRHATYIAHHFPTLGTYSGTQGLIPPRGPVPTDEQSIVKREVLARRIADLVPENQKTLIMHLRRLAPYVIKIQDGVLCGS